MCRDVPREKARDPVALDQLAPCDSQCFFAGERFGPFGAHPPVVELLLFLRTRIVNRSRSDVRGPPSRDGIEVIPSVNAARATAIKPFVNGAAINPEKPRDVVDRGRGYRLWFTRFSACRFGLRTLRNGTLGW